MNKRSVLAITLLLAAAATPCLAGEPPSEADMAAAMKAISPGEHHEHLAALEGKWTARVSSWMDPTAKEPMVSTGTSDFSWIMGGRYLQQDYKGSFMGMPFSGRGLSGYDNAAGHYVTTWVDTMGTGILYETGGCSNGGKHFEMSGEQVDPMSGTKMKIRSVHTIESADRNVLVMYVTSPGMEERKVMEIVYTR